MRVSAVLFQLGLGGVTSLTAFALLTLYVTGLILLDRRQTPWWMQEWLPARAHEALNRLLRVMSAPTRAIMRCLALWARRKGVSGTKLQLAQQMINNILPAGQPTDYIAFDSGFTDGCFTKLVGRCGLR